MSARGYRRALTLFMALVLAHWAEHVFQALQVYVLGWPRPQARGALGEIWPWLVTSEALHYGYAVMMLVGIVLLRQAFSGTARGWWDTALVLQIWHHAEHLLLLAQAIVGHPFFGAAQNTSLVQLAIPRIELHLFYNGVVFIPMVVALCGHYILSPARSQAASNPAPTTLGP